ncbi:MAG: BREX-2 system adenine-specific DNA-methyltransferase PglX [Deltaproteobacteria bacterium]|nr:BREX-2 system adenine-specific DNA-methyltransferase PglX [Deltaproteobacteria bacterium]
MARRSKKPKLADLPGQDDPKAPIDGATFLAAAQPVLKQLDKDLLARAKASPAVDAALKARHTQEKEEKRTAAGFKQWRERFVGQVGAAWLLSCVFVRVLEDRGLTKTIRIAGPGAADAQRLFFEMAPSLTERDYLLTVFRELTHYPASARLFDARHNPVWMLAPSAEAAKALLALFRTPSADTPAFRFGQESTRFLGDLYQDLDESVRKRFALLQTPDFVEAFILDRTLEPAIAKFGLDDTDLIDPTCGSGHFLLGAFDRLFEHRLRAEPGIERRQAALKALSQVAGADINPYAAAIARFRLTLSFLEKGGYAAIADAPELPIHVAVADSLLYNPQLEQQDFAFVEEGFERRAYELEDAAEAKAVLHREYAAVVGNPPYITVKDKALRDRYRALYPSAHGLYSLACPFMERFFQLARKSGRVGKITANSFMKREFGAKLIEDYLPTVDLDLVVNTSGAYIPGHGTPTVLLFGARRPPKEATVLSVLAKRGEPTTPADPAKGLVWTSIAEHWDELGYDDDYITVSKIDRSLLEAHPWTLAGGGAMELKTLLEQRAEGTLGDQVSSIGFMCITKQDDVFSQDRGVLTRHGIANDWLREFVSGGHVRDWSVGSDQEVLYPYMAAAELRDVRRTTPAGRFLWRFRRVLESRAVFGGKDFKQAGRKHYEYGQIPSDRTTGPAIAFAEVATHNHFVLDRGGKVFNRTAPIIKLPASATEEDHLALLAYLNSSTACFYMSLVSYPKGMHNGSESNATPFLVRYAFDGSKVAQVPLPPNWAANRERFAQLGRISAEIAGQRGEMTFEACVANTSDPSAAFDQTVAARQRLLRRLVAVQEEIDWLAYECFGLCENATYHRIETEPELRLGARLFERRLSRTLGGDDWFRWHETQAVGPDALDLPAEYRALERRRETTLDQGNLGMLEAPTAKRRWVQPAGKAAQELETDEKILREQRSTWLANRVETTFRSGEPGLRTTLDLRQRFEEDEPLVRVLSSLDDESGPGILIDRYVRPASVPYLDAWTYDESGLTKRAQWRETWRLQRQEDLGDPPTTIPIPIPPKYARKDYRSNTYYSLRGTLDVPKERFIAYPGCESDEDGEPVYGWAGWDHEQRAKALATLYYDRKTNAGWGKVRLTPMLAGLRELQFWLDLWHDEPSDHYGGTSPADYYRSFVNGECQTHGLTHDDLKAWRPPGKSQRKNRTRASGSTHSPTGAHE